MPALKEVYISLDAWREAICGNNDLEALLQPVVVAVRGQKYGMRKGKSDLSLQASEIASTRTFGAINVKIRSSFLYMHKKLYFCSVNIKR